LSIHSGFAPNPWQAIFSDSQVVQRGRRSSHFFFRKRQVQQPSLVRRGPLIEMKLELDDSKQCCQLRAGSQQNENLKTRVSFYSIKLFRWLRRWIYRECSYVLVPETVSLQTQSDLKRT
jgi:hypothetical protein